MDIQFQPMINKVINNEILLIENFFSTEYSQDLVKNRIYKENLGFNYPGRASHLNDIEKAFLKKKIEETLNITIDENFIARVRVTSKKDKSIGNSLVHYDAFPLVGVGYLSHPPDNEENYGTSFYEYKANGKRIVNYKNELEKLKWSIILENHSKLLDFWNPWKTFEFRFGQMIFYNGAHLHAPPTETFGEDDDSARITLEIFAHFPA